MKNITIYYGPKKGFEKELPYNNITLTELISMKEYKKNLIILKSEDNDNYRKRNTKFHKHIKFISYR